MGFSESIINLNILNKNHNKFKELERKKETFVVHRPVPLYLANEVEKSLCKITVTIKKNSHYNGTGFFMKIKDSKKYLITNYHIISEDTINNDIEIEIWNQKKMELKLINRDIRYIPKPKDITIIEITSNDLIYNDIQLLNYDLKYKEGYNIYKSDDVFTLEHPLGERAASASGRIININKFEFYHDISTDKGSSGCPIILLNNNNNNNLVIGIHKEKIHSTKLNCGTFIGEIFKKYYDLTNNFYNSNYIIAEIDINVGNINKDVRIINSYEESTKIYRNIEEVNEEEIKKCEIRLDSKLIPFNYFYKFNKEGKYILTYSFKNYLTKTNYLFYECKLLTNINLSNFNTKNVINMRSMFFDCKSLTNINFDNFNTQKVTDMSHMFEGCKSLMNFDLSNFNTQNVTNMSQMFSDCKSLKNLNLSNFNTEKLFIWVVCFINVNH